MGDADTLESGGATRTVDEVNAALGRTRGARPLDSVEDRRALVEGGPSTRVELLLRRAEGSFVKLKYAEAVRDYEAAEALLLEEVPFGTLQARLGEVERNLLACYDQLGRPGDAARAAERLSWAAGAKDDVATLMQRHYTSRAWAPAAAPVTVQSEPAGAQVYRNLAPLGAAPQSVAGGDPSVDIVDVEAPGYRRAHRPLRAGETLTLALVKEDRLGVLVDRVRVQAPDAAPKDVAAVGRRVGAVRVLVLLPDGPKKLLGRWLDVRKGTWAPDSVRVDASGPQAMTTLATYVAPPAPAPVVAAAPPPAEKKSKLGRWGKWYTWVAAGAVVALVGGLLIAQNVGDSQLTVTASH